MKAGLEGLRTQRSEDCPPQSEQFRTWKTGFQVLALLERFLPCPDQDSSSHHSQPVKWNNSTSMEWCTVLHSWHHRLHSRLPASIAGSVAGVEPEVTEGSFPWLARSDPVPAICLQLLLTSGNITNCLGFGVFALFCFFPRNMSQPGTDLI